MSPDFFNYALLGSYLVAVYWLSWLGMRRTRDMQGFTIGALTIPGWIRARYGNPALSLFSVFGSGFIITFALMLQLHILTKVLYLRSEWDCSRFIGTTVMLRPWMSPPA